MQQFTRNRLRYILIVLASVMLVSLVPAHRAYAEKPYKDCKPSEVHPIWWKARIRYDVDARILGTDEETTLERGTRVTVISNNRTGSRKIMLKNGDKCKVPGNAVSIYEDACTKGDYSKATKLAFVNSRNIYSKTKYMIWVSTDMQSLNVFKGKNRKWELVKTFKCSTGMAGYETPLGQRRIVTKMHVCHSIEWESDLFYFLSFGGSGIHKWPGPNSKQGLGKKPCSHACIRLSTKNAIWCYKHIPVNTRLYIY